MFQSNIRFVVITGLSGSGKSSLAFESLGASWRELLERKSIVIEAKRSKFYGLLAKHDKWRHTSRGKLLSDALFFRISWRARFPGFEGDKRRGKLSQFYCV